MDRCTDTVDVLLFDRKNLNFSQIQISSNMLRGSLNLTYRKTYVPLVKLTYNKLTNFLEQVEFVVNV